MSYIVLSRKWRPRNFDQVVGQKHVTKILSNALLVNKVSHSYLFSGPRGVGKTTVARILASNLNNLESLDKSLDVIELDGASNRGIDEIRDLKDAAKYVPIEGKYKIFIIDEAHMLTKEAFNALLKTLEEPPPHVVFILATTENQKIPATISSRCQKYDFKKISLDDTVKHLGYIVEKEGYASDPKALRAIASKSDGSLRDALSLLDKVFSISSNEVTYDMVKSVLGIVDQDLYLNIAQKMISGEVSNVIRYVNSALDSGISSSVFMDGFIKYTRDSICYLVMHREELELSSESKSFWNNNKSYLVNLKQVLGLCIDYINSNYNQISTISLENLFLKIVDINSDNRNLSKEESVEDLKEDKESYEAELSKGKDTLYPKNKEIPHFESINSTGLDQIWKNFLNRLESSNVRLYCVLEKVRPEIEADNKIFLKTSNLSKYDSKIIIDNLEDMEKSINKTSDREIYLDISQKEDVDNNEADLKVAKNDSDTSKALEKKVEKEDFKEHPLTESAISDYNGKIIK